MEANIIGHDEEDCGVEVYDERGNRHTVTMSWDGEVWEHGTEDYPHKREDRTQDEQRILSQVQERAKYAAQQEFPEADILDPMWDPEHLKAGLEALSKYDIERFHDQFRDFYRAVVDPAAFISNENFERDEVIAVKHFRVQDGQITDVAPVVVRHYVNDSTVEEFGSVPSYPADEHIICFPPVLEFEDDFDYYDGFHDIVVTHLLAQIRDVYLNMGEMPPEEYRVEGIGKHDIHGDGIGDT